MNQIGLALFVGAAGLLWSRNMRYSVGFLAAEGVLLALMVWTAVPWPVSAGLVGLATLAIKGVLIPGALLRVLRTWPEDGRRDQSLPLWAYGAAVVAVLAVGHVIALLAPTGLVHHALLFFYALGTIHLGLVMVVARRHLLSQLAALVSMENGLVLLAVSVAGSLPTFVELGMLIDLGIAVALMVWASHRIHQVFETTDVVALRRLRG